MSKPRKVMKAGKFTGKWIVQIRRKGFADMAKTFNSKLEAERWSIKQRESLGIIKPEASSKTLFDALERYRLEVTPLRKGKRWEDVRLLNFQRMPEASMRLINITTDTMQEWINRRMLQVKGSTIRRELNLISAVFTACIDVWGWCEKNPVSKTRKPAKPQHRDRLITDDEVVAIIEALGYIEGQPIITQQQHVAWGLLFALETAMRQGEIWGLQWQDVYIDAQYVTLHETKNGTRRQVPLSSRAVTLLKMVRRPAGRVIPYNQASCAQMYRAAVRICGIEGITFHDARHTAITRLARKLQPLELAKMVGHKNLGMLMTYYNESASSIAKRLD